MNSFRFLARADPLQPLIDGRPRGDALELATQEPLHRLVPPRGAQGEPIPYLFRNAPYGDLYRHDCIMPPSPADGNRRDSVGYRLRLRPHAAFGAFHRRTVKRCSSSIRSGSVPLCARIPGTILFRTPMPRAST